MLHNRILPTILLFLILSINIYANKINAKYILPDKITFVGSNQPPYEYYDKNNNLTGYHVELIDEIMKRLGKEYEIVLLNWPDARKMIDNNEADVMMGMMYTEERTNKYSFGLAHSFTSMGIVSTRQMFNAKLSDVTDSKVIVQAGGRMDEDFNINGIKCKVIPAQSIEDGLNMLIRGIGDYMICNSIIANYYNNKLKLGLHINNIEDILPDKYCMAVQKGNENLLLSISNVMQDLKADGTYDELYEKWFGVYEAKGIPTWVYYTGFALIIFSLIILLFTIYMRVKVNKATKKIALQNKYITIQNEQIKEQNEQITEQNRHIKLINRELTTLNEELSIILKNSNSGYVFLSPEMDIIWENVSVCKTLNFGNIYSKHGNKCYNQVSDRNKCSNCPVKHSMSSGKIETYITTTPEGIPIEMTSIPVINEDVLIGYVLRIDNISEREKRFVDLSNEKDDLIKYEIVKSAFISKISHDLQSPVNSLINISSLLNENDDFITAERYRTLINTNGVLLQKLVNDVLNMSNIESGHIFKHKTYFDINQLFFEIENLLLNKISNLENIKFSLELEKTNCIINTDRNRLKQVIINFISNSIKFTQEGSIIAGYFIEDKIIKIYVEDTGCGIEKANIENLFENLPDIQNINYAEGIGLSICKSIADALGADIGAESEPGKGSIFWISMPIDVEEKIEI